MPYKNNEIIAVILSGGLSRRMDNRNKAFIKLANKPLFEYVLENISAQCDTVIINSNCNGEQFEQYQLPVVKDSIEGFLGPLAGILTAMEWVKENSPEAQWLVSVPVDTPFLPNDLVKKLHHASQQDKASLVCAVSNERTHPIIGLWPISLMDDLRTAIQDEDMRKIDLWTARYKISHPVFEYEDIDPFFNINCDEDLAEAETLIT